MAANASIYVRATTAAICVAFLASFVQGPVFAQGMGGMGSRSPIIFGQYQLSVDEDNSLAISLNNLIVFDSDSRYPQDFSLNVRNGQNYSVSGNVVTPALNYFGILRIPVTVNDGTSNSNIFSLRVSVTSVNDVPTIILNGAASTTLLQGENYTDAGATAFDVEDGNISSNIVRTGTVNTASAGVYVLSFDVDDSIGSSAVRVQRIVTVRTNNIPTITLNGLPTVTIEIGQMFNDPGATAIDPEDGPLVPVITGSVNTGVLGDNLLIYTATDSDGNIATAKRIVTVIRSNEPPQLDGPITPNPLSATENTPFNFLVAGFFSDPDGDALTYRAIGLPPTLNLSINPLTGVIAGTPDHSDAQGSPYNVVVTALDGQFSVSDNGVTLNIADVNTAPLANGPIPAQIATENATFSLNAAQFFSDPDGDALMFSAVGLPISGNLTIDPVTGMIGGDPTDAEAQGSPYTIELVATDPSGLVAGGPTHSFTLTIIDVNNPPVENATPNDLPAAAPNATESFPYEFRLASFFSDADGDALVFQVDGLPDSGSLTVNATSGLISGVPTAADTADTPLNLAVTVTDIPRLPFKPTSLGPLPLTLSIPALDRADLGISLLTAPEPATVDAIVSWTLTVANLSPVISVAQIDIAAELAGNPFTFTDVGECTATLQTLSCVAGPIPPNSDITVTVLGRATQAGDVVMTATASVSQITGLEPIDPIQNNNTAVATQNIGESFSSGPGQTLAEFSGQALAAGDINGDGHTDLVVATASGISTKIFLSTPKFTATAAEDPIADLVRQLSAEPMALGDVSSSSTAIRLIDLDNDGDLDLAIANGTPGAPQGNSVLMNESTESQLVLTPIPALLGNETSHDVAAADLDGNGYVDLIFANGSPNELFFNMGGGSFFPGTPLGDSDSRAVTVDDFDGDGITDLLFANIDGPSLAYRGLGGGVFSAGVAIDVGPVVSAQNTDVSGDGQPDLIFGRQTATLPALPSNVIYLNTSTVGQLSFTPIGAALGTSPTVKVLSDDVSLDGTIDLVTLNTTGTHQIFVGSGNGAFRLHPEQFLSSSTTSGAFGDFNNDGRVDLAVGGSDDIGIFLNDGHGNLGAGDTTFPVIQLSGPSSVAVEVGETYVDAAATAFDEVDGDVTERIATTNPVDTAIVGSYVVTYNVFDSSGNRAPTISRTVTVAPREGVGGGGGGAVTSWLLALLTLLLFLRWRAARNEL